MYRYTVDNAVTYTSEDLVLFRESPFACWMERLTLENPDHGIPPDLDAQPPGNSLKPQDELAETLRALAQEGERLFYEGDIATAIDAACRSEGGQLRYVDLEQYQVRRRRPLHIQYRDAAFYTNPAPSSGGLLIGFALKLLERHVQTGLSIDSVEGISQLAELMQSTNQARLDGIRGNGLDERMLDPVLLEQYQHQVRGRARSFRGTTHISVIDRRGNLASLTASNGEGCGHMLGDTGIM